MNIKRAIKKTFFVIISAFIVLVIASITSAYLFKDQLIDHFIREANKQLNTPINIGKISVSALDNFPQMTLKFEDVYIQESFNKSSYPLLTSEKIEFTFNPLEIYKGDYAIEQIHISNASCHFKVNESGDTNYRIFKKNDTTNAQKVRLDLSKVTLTEIDFKYSNYKNDVYIEANANRATANVGIEGRIFDFKTEGEYYLTKLVAQNNLLIENKSVSAVSDFVYNDETKYVNFKQSSLTLEGAIFQTYGNYEFLNTPKVEFYVEAKDSELKSLVAILPEKYTKRLAKYKSSGDVYFDLSLIGEFGKNLSPSLEVNFGLHKAQVLYPEKDVKITEANAEGTFTAAKITNLEAGSLDLRNISGELENKKFTGNLLLDNLKDIFLRMDFDGEIAVGSLFKFLDSKEIVEADGLLQVNLSLAGKINDLKSRATSANMRTSGEIDIKNLNIEHKSFQYPLSNVNGNLLFNNNDLAISDVSGYYGSSDYLLNGFFKNIIAYLLFENEPVGIEADLKSSFINLDELLVQKNNSASSEDYIFNIAPKLILKFNCDIDRLQFRRFKPKEIKGDLKIKNQVAYTDRLQFRAMGGDIGLSGLVDATTNDIEVNSSFTVNKVYIDSIFYVFENFNQTFLEDRHLEGQIIADVQTNMQLTKQLRLKPATLTANINTSILGGQLNKFEPMQKLARYVDEEKLDHLTFSELRNEIFVENQTIYLPEMEVSSNVTDIRISGTHTFDQKIAYRVVAPLRSRQKIDSDEAFGAIEQDNEGRSMLFLKIMGTTDDYKIIYDKESVKQKIVSDLKKEVQELKNAFKNKGLDKNKTVELEEDDYFDWDEDGK